MVSITLKYEILFLLVKVGLTLALELKEKTDSPRLDLSMKLTISLIEHESPILNSLKKLTVLLNKKR